MKRTGCLIDRIADFDNLALAAYKAFRHKRKTTEIINYQNNLYDNLCHLRGRILSGEINFGEYRQFTIFEPKERKICAAPLPERVLHHAIMNICHQYFDNNQIFDSYASRPGKGVHRAVLRVQKFCRGNIYYAKLDFKKYFDSIDHRILKSLLSRIFKDAHLLLILNCIIDSYEVSGKGIPIGNLTSQYFANYYLSGLDHRMKENIKTRCYVRYMDDVIILGRSKQEIKYYVYEYVNFASETLRLTTKHPIIGRICQGVPFLGFKIFSDKIILGGKAKRSYIKNVNTLTKLYNQCKISEKCYSERLNANLAYISFAESYKFRKNIVVNVNELQPG